MSVYCTENHPKYIKYIFTLNIKRTRLDTFQATSDCFDYKYFFTIEINIDCTLILIPSSKKRNSVKAKF